MSPQFPQRARLFEFAVGVAVIAVAALFLLDALARIEEQAEKLVVEATVRNIDSGLRLAQAELITQQRENERAALLRVNPVGWLERPPEGYIGEADGVDPEALAAGQWVWDRRARILIYRPRRGGALKVEGGAGWLGWRIVAAGQALGTLRVEGLRAYEWRP